MKRILIILSLLLGLPLLAFLGLSLYGSSLPENHQETITVELKAPVSEVWGLLKDYQGMTGWWSEVQAVEDEKQDDGTLVTWNTDNHGERVGFITIYEVLEKKLTRRVYDPHGKLPYGGSWSYELDAISPQETSLLIVEDGFIKPPFFRAVSKLIFGKRMMLESFVKAIQKKTDVAATAPEANSAPEAAPAN